MIVATRPVHGSLQQALAGDGFAFVRGPVMRSLLADLLPLADFDRFTASWSDLPLDTYMADGGRYRRRRHATYAAGRGAIVRQPHQPHFQSREYNSLNGGITRWFEPVQPDIGAGDTLQDILRVCDWLFGELAQIRVTRC